MCYLNCKSGFDKIDVHIYSGDSYFEKSLSFIRDVYSL